MAEALQHKGQIDNRGLFHRELLAQFNRRGLVTYSGNEQFHDLVEPVAALSG